MIGFTKKQTSVLGAGLLGQIDRARDAQQQQQITVRVIYQGSGSDLEQGKVVSTLRQLAAGQRLHVEHVDELDELIRLKAELSRAYQRIQNLERAYAEVQEAAAFVTRRDREYMTAQEAAAAVGISYYTACRYLEEGFWLGRKERGRWQVFIDQPLQTKRRK